MNSTTDFEMDISSKILLTTCELQALLSCGRSSAIKIGELAKAKVSVGRRVFWCRAKVDSYFNNN